jgi:hypothetical protein
MALLGALLLGGCVTAEEQQHRIAAAEAVCTHQTTMTPAECMAIYQAKWDEEARERRARAAAIMAEGLDNAGAGYRAMAANPAPHF